MNGETESIDLSNNLLHRLAFPYIKDYVITGHDLNRPWGGFYYIDKNYTRQFIGDFFKQKSSELLDLTETTDIENLGHVSYSPKILIISPNQRLSWQYHYKRKEVWSVLEGPVGIMLSPDNNERDMIIANKGDIICVDKEERHRIIGLSNYSIIAELWWHINILDPSEEGDIVRLQDDYKR